MAGNEDASTSEAPEVRDNAEVAEEAERVGITASAGAPIGANGLPMRRIWATISDKVPTVQFGNVVLTAGAEEWIENFGTGIEGRQHRIDRTRELMKDVEFVVGVERRLLQWAVDPASKVASPVTAQDAFAAPPQGYDVSQVSDPRDAAAEAAMATPAGQAAVSPQPATEPPPQAPPPASVG